MRGTVDTAGRLLVPESLRDELGFLPGTELDLRVVDGRLQVEIRSRVRCEDGPQGVRFAAEEDDRVTVDQVRDVIQRGRR